MTKLEDIYEAADDFGLITASEASALGVPHAELVQYAARGKLDRVARGVYQIAVWPYQEAAPYAIAVKSVGNGAYLYGESVVALLKLAPTNPSRMWVASPRRIRKHLGEGFRVVGPRKGDRTAFYEGVRCQHAANAIADARGVIGNDRSVAAAAEAFRHGYITEEEKNALESGAKHD